MPFKYLWCFFIMDSSCGLCETHETPCNRNIKGQRSSCPSGNYAFVGSQMKSTDCGHSLFSFLNPNNASKQTAKKYLSKISRWLYSLHIVCWTPLEEACSAANGRFSSLRVQCPESPSREQDHTSPLRGGCRGARGQASGVGTAGGARLW